jgi:hemerythrin superfamily protein
MINYEEIIKDWNFKESSTLYNSLNKIKEKGTNYNSKTNFITLRDTIVTNNTKKTRPEYIKKSNEIKKLHTLVNELKTNKQHEQFTHVS